MSIKRPIRTIINDLIQIASELEEFEVSLTSFLGTSFVPLRQTYDSHTERGETTKSVPFQVPEVPLAKLDGQRRKHYSPIRPKADLNKQQKSQIRLLYNQGMTIPQLVETYQSNDRQIQAILKNNMANAIKAAKEKAHKIN